MPLIPCRVLEDL